MFYASMWIAALLCACCYIFAFYLLRRKDVWLSVGEQRVEKNILSPINGTVVSLSNVVLDDSASEVQCLQIKMNYLAECGIRFPVAGEIDKFMQERRSRKIRHLPLEPGVCGGVSDYIEILSHKKYRLRCGFMSCIFGAWPVIRVMPGDIGGASAIAGFWPFGGTVLLYLSKQDKILVSAGDNVVSGITPVAEIGSKVEN